MTVKQIVREMRREANRLSKETGNPVYLKRAGLLRAQVTLLREYADKLEPLAGREDDGA